MNQKKSEDYTELVKDMWELYLNYGIDPPKSNKVKLWAPSLYQRRIYL